MYPVWIKLKLNQDEKKNNDKNNDNNFNENKYDNNYDTNNDTTITTTTTTTNDDDDDDDNYNNNKYNFHICVAVQYITIQLRRVACTNDIPVIICNK